MVKEFISLDEAMECGREAVMQKLDDLAFINSAQVIDIVPLKGIGLADSFNQMSHMSNGNGFGIYSNLIQLQVNILQRWPVMAPDLQHL